jgi:hypothetical protein
MVIQLPSSIEVSNPQEESTIRLCMKVVIGCIFKGQASAQQPLFQFGGLPDQF